VGHAPAVVGHVEARIVRIVLADPAEVRQAHRLPRAPLVAGRRRLPRTSPEVDEEVLVRQRDADRVRRYGTEHRLDLAGERSGHPLPEGRRDLRDEPIEVTTQLVQRTEHARDEQRVHPGGLEPRSCSRI